MKKSNGESYWFEYDSTGRRHSINYNGTLYYYYYNAQGDVMGLRNTSGQSVVQYTYDSWGYVQTIQGTLASTLGYANPFFYRGYYMDTETGLYYLNSRYYDPETGRFLNADGQLNNGILGNNLFAYCENNPVNNSDSSGRWFGIDDLIAAGVGAVVGAVSQLVSDCTVSLISGEWQFSSWQVYVGAGIGGAIGGVASLYASPVVGAAIGTGAATLIGQTLEKITGGTKRSAKEIAINTVTDATIGAAISKVVPVKVSGITAGKNSMEAVFKSGLTKLGNKTASHMSTKVVGKGITSGLVSDVGIASGLGFKSHIENPQEQRSNSIKPTYSGTYYWCAP